MEIGKLECFGCGVSKLLFSVLMEEGFVDDVEGGEETRGGASDVN